jgi:hypothetical protein
METCSECSETSKRGKQNIGLPGAGHLLLALLLLLGGCAGAQNGAKGSLTHTGEVTQLFESNTVLPDHVYYYSGPEAEPEAIIGIQSGYAFQGKYWYQVALTPGQLQAWNRRIDNAHRIRFSYKGARIMTPDGKQVGVWYSPFEHTVIRFPEANTILIYAPGPAPTGGFLDGSQEGNTSGGRGPRQ